MSQNQRRSESSEVLGTCGNCGATIPRSGLLIQYESAEGWPKLFAECFGCEEVVHPE